MISKSNKYNFIDLFSGAGGLSLGFTLADFKSVFAVENDPAAAKTYELNFGPHVFCGDIKDVDDFTRYNAQIIIGGPPCQGFSPLGKMSARKGRIEEHKELNQLWKHYLRAVRQIQPLAFVVENVPEFLSSEGFSTFKKSVEQLGYNVASGVLKAEDFGVPQKRRRGFILGVLGTEIFLPLPTAERRTVRDAIGDLPLNPTEKNLHWSRNPRPLSIERYKCIPPGGNRFDLMRKRPDLSPKCWLRKPTGSTDVFGRLEWDKPSLTIRTEFYKPEIGRCLHPEAHRPITHREAARLQTFPDYFRFFGSKIQIAQQIGNAVPPLLAKCIAKHIEKTIDPAEAHKLQELQLAVSII